LIEFISCSTDVYNLMVSGIIDDWHSTFSQRTLLSKFLNDTDITQRYDNFSIHLLGSNINIKDEFTVWKLHILDVIDFTDIHSMHRRHSSKHVDMHSIKDTLLFLMSYMTLMKGYSVRYVLPEMLQSHMVQTTRTATRCEITIRLRHLKQFMKAVARKQKRNRSKSAADANQAGFQYHDCRKSLYRNAAGSDDQNEEFECNLMHYDRFEQLLGHLVDGQLDGMSATLLRYLKNELFLPDLVSFQSCGFVSIYVALLERIFFGHCYLRKLNYTACFVELESKLRANKYTQSYVVWNAVLNDECL